MIEKLPVYISIVFILCTLYTLFVFYWVVRNAANEKIRKKANTTLVIFATWLAIQGLLSLKGVYTDDPEFMPPKIFLLGILPNLLMYLWFFFSKLGREFMDSLPRDKFTFVHLVRIPVEFVLLWLFLNKTIPQIMTFEGWNFDIVMGLTAIPILFLIQRKKTINRQLLILWNIIGILFLIFIFSIAILSSPFPLQQLAFDQPNIGILHFPFSWLATFIVPVVIFSHMVSIRQLLKSR